MCCSETHKSSAVALIKNIFVSEIEQKQSIFCQKSKSLNFTLFEVLLYKISVTLQSFWYSGKHPFFFCSMRLYFSVSYFVCAVSLTHSLRLCKPHLARHKYIISCHLYWLKLEPISRKTMCLHTTVSVRVAVTSLPAPLAIKGSARNRYYMRLTGRSPIRTGQEKNRQIQITGRSIGAPLILSMQQLVTL